MNEVLDRSPAVAWDDVAGLTAAKQVGGWRGYVWWWLWWWWRGLGGAQSSAQRPIQRWLSRVRRANCVVGMPACSRCASRAEEALAGSCPGLGSLLLVPAPRHASVPARLPLPPDPARRCKRWSSFPACAPTSSRACAHLPAACCFMAHQVWQRYMHVWQRHMHVWQRYMHVCTALRTSAALAPAPAHRTTGWRPTRGRPQSCAVLGWQHCCLRPAAAAVRMRMAGAGLARETAVQRRQPAEPHGALRRASPRQATPTLTPRHPRPPRRRRQRQDDAGQGAGTRGQGNVLQHLCGITDQQVRRRPPSPCLLVGTPAPKPACSRPCLLSPCLLDGPPNASEERLPGSSRRRDAAGACRPCGQP